MYNRLLRQTTYFCYIFRLSIDFKEIIFLNFSEEFLNPRSPPTPPFLFPVTVKSAAFLIFFFKSWVFLTLCCLFDSTVLLRCLAKKVVVVVGGGMCSCAKRLNKDICFHLFCHHHWQHRARAEQTLRWIGAFVSRIKEMLSQVNEGRFTQYNDGWTHGFTADMHLKGPGKYSFRTEGFICRYTYPLHPPAPTWGSKLSSKSLLFLLVI